MAQTALDILSLTRAKTELRIEDGIVEHNVLLEDQISAAVSWVAAYLSAPLIQTREAWPARIPYADAERPVYVSASHIQRVFRARYWTPDAPVRDDPDGTILMAALGRTVQLSKTLWEVWPPADGWPERERGTDLYADVVRELHPLPGGIVAACVAVVRSIYDGVADIRPTSALRALLDPYRDYIGGDVGYPIDLSADDAFVDLSPAGTTVVDTNYLALRAADTNFVPADFTVSGQTDAAGETGGRRIRRLCASRGARRFHIRLRLSGRQPERTEPNRRVDATRS